jgi:NodT family efflux transporter outer membrane factor (OMF) lipoprotein
MVPIRSRRPRLPGVSAQAAAFLAAASLAGCNMAPAYAPPAVTVAPAYREQGPWTQAQPADALEKGAWWTPFGDPMLDTLEGQVETANPTLAAALAAYDQARALAQRARSDLVPTVSAVGDSTQNRQSDERPLRGAGEPNQYAVNEAGMDVSYEFDFWGRVRNRVAAGEAEAQASAADLATARLSLRVELAADYLGLRGLDAQTGLLRNTVDAYARALDMTRKRHRGGVGTGLDVERAATQLSSAKAQVSDVLARRALLEHAIASLAGQSASSFSIVPADRALAIPEVPTGVPSTLLQRRPDVAAAERRAFAANRRIGVARAAYYPAITLDAQAGYQNTGGDGLLVAPNTVWTIGPQVAFTLLDGGRRRATVAASKAAFLLASAQYRAAVLSAFQDVEDQLAQANHLADEAKDEADAVRSARATTAMSLTRYRDGAATYLDVVTAQTSELQAEQTALSLQTRRQQTSVALVRALGGGWTQADLPKLKKVADHARS